MRLEEKFEVTKGGNQEAVNRRKTDNIIPKRKRIDILFLGTVMSLLLAVFDTALCDSLSVTCDRLVVFSGYSSFLHQ